MVRASTRSPAPITIAAPGATTIVLARAAPLSKPASVREQATVDRASADKEVTAAWVEPWAEVELAPFATKTAGRCSRISVLTLHRSKCPPSSRVRCHLRWMLAWASRLPSTTAVQTPYWRAAWTAVAGAVAAPIDATTFLRSARGPTAAASATRRPAKHRGIPRSAASEETGSATAAEAARQAILSALWQHTMVRARR